MSIRKLIKDKRGFSLVEILIASVIILLIGIALAKGILDLIQQRLRVQVRQTAIQAVENWASYIEALPYDSWIINPGENSEDAGGSGGNALYCGGCAFNRGLCDKNPRDWSGTGNQFYCSFMDPNYLPNRPYDSDADGIIALLDPYHGVNDCSSGQANCNEQERKYRYPSWYIAGHLRFLPDWGQGSSDCVCRLGNCINTSECRVHSWQSSDGSMNFSIDQNCMGGLKCVYEVRRGISGGGVGWNSSAGDRVFIGMTVINYYHVNNPVRPAGKAIGIIAWYFDPVDKGYKAVNKIVFKERP